MMVCVYAMKKLRFIRYRIKRLINVLFRQYVDLINNGLEEEGKL